jgi:transcriptional regulator with XRE-family HTH domain
MEVGKRLVVAREYLGLTQNQVASILHITIEELKIYEARHYINPVELKPFLKLYGVTKEDLYEKDEDITIKIKGFENLSKQDKKAVFNLLKMLKEFKKRR